MGIEYPESRVLDSQARNKFRAVDNESVTLGINDRVVEVASDTAAVTVTLPNVDEAAGKTFAITAPNGLTNAVTVTDGAGGSVDFQGDYALNADADGIVLYSDGRKWWQFADGGA